MWSGARTTMNGRNNRKGPTTPQFMQWFFDEVVERSEITMKWRKLLGQTPKTTLVNTANGIYAFLEKAKSFPKLGKQRVLIADCEFFSIENIKITNSQYTFYVDPCIPGGPPTYTLRGDRKHGCKCVNFVRTIQLLSMSEFEVYNLDLVPILGSTESSDITARDNLLDFLCSSCNSWFFWNGSDDMENLRHTLYLYKNGRGQGYCTSGYTITGFVMSILANYLPEEHQFKGTSGLKHVGGHHIASSHGKWGDMASRAYVSMKSEIETKMVCAGFDVNDKSVVRKINTIHRMALNGDYGITKINSDFWPQIWLDYSALDVSIVFDLMLLCFAVLRPDTAALTLDHNAFLETVAGPIIRRDHQLPKPLPLPVDGLFVSDSMGRRLTVVAGGWRKVSIGGFELKQCARLAIAAILGRLPNDKACRRLQVAFKSLLLGAGVNDAMHISSAALRKPPGTARDMHIDSEVKEVVEAVKELIAVAKVKEIHVMVLEVSNVGEKMKTAYPPLVNEIVKLINEGLASLSVLGDIAANYTFQPCSVPTCTGDGKDLRFKDYLHFNASGCEMFADRINQCNIPGRPDPLAKLVLSRAVAHDFETGHYTDGVRNFEGDKQKLASVVITVNTNSRNVGTAASGSRTPANLAEVCVASGSGESSSTSAALSPSQSSSPDVKRAKVASDSAHASSKLGPTEVPTTMAAPSSSNTAASSASIPAAVAAKKDNPPANVPGPSDLAAPRKPIEAPSPDRAPTRKPIQAPSCHSSFIDDPNFIVQEFDPTAENRKQEEPYELSELERRRHDDLSFVMKSKCNRQVIHIPPYGLCLLSGVSLICFPSMGIGQRNYVSDARVKRLGEWLINGIVSSPDLLECFKAAATFDDKGMWELVPYKDDGTYKPISRGMARYLELLPGVYDSDDAWKSFARWAMESYLYAGADYLPFCPAVPGMLATLLRVKIPMFRINPDENGNPPDRIDRLYATPITGARGVPVMPEDLRPYFRLERAVHERLALLYSNECHYDVVKQIPRGADRMPHCSLTMNMDPAVWQEPLQPAFDEEEYHDELEAGKQEKLAIMNAPRDHLSIRERRHGANKRFANPIKDRCQLVRQQNPWNLDMCPFHGRARREVAAAMGLTDSDRGESPRKLYCFRRLKELSKFLQTMRKGCRSCFDEALADELVKLLGNTVDLQRYVSWRGYETSSLDREYTSDIGGKFFLALQNALNSIGMWQSHKDCSFNLGNAIRCENMQDMQGSWYSEFELFGRIVRGQPAGVSEYKLSRDYLAHRWIREHWLRSLEIGYLPMQGGVPAEQFSYKYLCYLNRLRFSDHPVVRCAARKIIEGPPFNSNLLVWIWTAKHGEKWSAAILQQL